MDLARGAVHKASACNFSEVVVAKTNQRRDGEGGKPTHVPENQAFSTVPEGEKPVNKDASWTVRKLGRLSRFCFNNL
jgi:hypothetical protein